MQESSMLAHDSTFYVAGHAGLVGSAVWRHLQAKGFTKLVGFRSSELDLRDRSSTFEMFAQQRPRYVVLAAAKVGGIAANNKYPVEFLSDNIRIQTNVLDAALKFDVERLLFLGSSCIYPKWAEQPIQEDSLMTGHLEPTNDAYAVAKIAGIHQVRAARRQFGKAWISAMPTNLYGPNDNFDEGTSHVLPALIRRFDEASRAGIPVVTNWGSGMPRREFLHVDDLAAACLFLLENYDGIEHINVGTGVDSTIKEISALVAKECGYIGDVVWDKTKPDGTMRKLLDVSRIKSLGWEPTIDLRTGIEQTVSWYRRNYGRRIEGRKPPNQID